MGAAGESRTGSWLPAVWRLCSAAMSLFFTLAACVQVNDPDAGFWMAGYAVPAVLSAFTAAHPPVTETRVWRRVADLHVTVCSAAAAALGWSLYREGATRILQHEEGREFSGLLLALLWLLLSRRSGRSPVGVLRVSAAVSIAVFPFVSWTYYHVHKELRSSWPRHCTTVL
ncbi:transmembrane protein 220 [Salarias fasciatus]|uniref:Transmembrane protein 220 n=1 Tax=Salarias fasciatus TaxID=181472 RepID=A0A672HVN1_SALFA|nr:transmembrane protein 220 [Salarias fasciatus]